MTASVAEFRGWVMMITIFAGMMMLTSYPLYSVQAILPESDG
jgi:hypothetical protein